jgi:hypothetical protein
MRRNIDRPVVLKRPLLEPDTSVLYPMYEELSAAMLRRSSVRNKRLAFADPRQQSIGTLGAAIIANCCEDARPHSQIDYMSLEEIAESVRASLPPSADELLVVRGVEHQLTANSLGSMSFGVRVQSEEARAEHRAAIIAVRDLAGFGPHRGKPHDGAVTWMHGAMHVPNPMENTLVGIATRHIPPTTELVFGPVELCDTSRAGRLFVPLSQLVEAT